mgnify:CR=1 FL=1
MERGIQTKEAPRTGTVRMYRSLAALALLPACFLAGCSGEQSADVNNSPSPYSSETTTPQPETDGSKKIIDIDNNSMYYAKYDNREGFSAYCVGRDYETPYIADCSVYLCDGNDMVRFEFDNIDFTEQTQRKRIPEASDLMLRADTLARQYEDYAPTETSKNIAECREKKSNVGQFTEPVSFPRGEQEQYLCLPQFTATIDNKKMGMKITKITSVDEKDNGGLYYPHYTVNLSEKCFNMKTLD